MKWNLLIHDTGSVKGGTVYICWYWASVTWHCLVLNGTGLVQSFMPVHIEKVEIRSDVTIVERTGNKRTRKDRATQPMDHGRLR